MRRRAGPNALVEPAEDDEIGLLQPGFDQTPDRQPGMAAIERADNSADRQRLEQGRIMASRQRRKIAGGIDQLVVETGRGFPGRLAPQPVGAGLVVGCGQPFGRLDMRGR